jgi:hypothetical protein
VGGGVSRFAIGGSVVGLGVGLHDGLGVGGGVSRVSILLGNGVGD